MRKILPLVFAISIAAHVGAAETESTAWERSAYVIAASAIYVSYDYFVFYPNQWQAGTTEEVAFRISQLALLGGLTWFLIDKFGWKTGVSFGALYLSWNFDAAYYWMAGRNSWIEVERGEVTWGTSHARRMV